VHPHGFPFKIVATGEFPVPEAARLTRDTVNVAPGERYDIEFVAEEEGTWIFHCHVLHHVTNDDLEPGGLNFATNCQIVKPEGPAARILHWACIQLSGIELEDQYIKHAGEFRVRCACPGILVAFSLVRRFSGPS